MLTFELGPDGAVDEEVDGGVDGEGEVVGAGQAEVPGGPHQPLAAPGTWFRVREWIFLDFNLAPIPVQLSKYDVKRIYLFIMKTVSRERLCCHLIISEVSTHSCTVITTLHVDTGQHHVDDSTKI